MKPSSIEQIKLTAGLLNAVSTGIILGALVAPYISIGLGQVPPNASPFNLVGLSAFGLVLGIVIHLVARRTLTALDD